MDLAVIILYTLASVLILIYSISQLHLLVFYLRSRNKPETSPGFDLSLPEETPFVTIQLPLYNELYVVERLLENISEIEYPREKLEIQVLDDSTDESVEKTQLLVKELQQKGEMKAPPIVLDSKDFGIGAQILHDLEIHKIKLLSNSRQTKRVGMIGYGLEITEYVTYGNEESQSTISNC